MNRNKGFTLLELLIVLVFVIAAGAISIAVGSAVLARDTIVATVTEKGERCNRGHDCKYLIYTDKGTLENTDSLLNWKWDSSDVYGDLVVGQRYMIKTQGVRVPFLSMYPNVISATVSQ